MKAYGIKNVPFKYLLSILEEYYLQITEDKYSGLQVRNHDNNS
jgi:hypothetical protein